MTQWISGILQIIIAFFGLYISDSVISRVNRELLTVCWRVKVVLDEKSSRLFYVSRGLPLMVYRTGSDVGRVWQISRGFNGCKWSFSEVYVTEAPTLCRYVMTG